MTRRIGAAMAALCLSLLLLAPAWAEGPTFDSIASQLVCQCGCNSVLNNCVHGECMVRDKMSTQLTQYLQQGQSQEAILTAFVGQYGEKVLAAPTKQGFNLTAWITPFAALAAGAGIVYLAVMAWVRRGQRPAPIATNEEDDAYRKRVEDELEHYPGGHF